jgi:hypothetical protein
MTMKKYLPAGNPVKKSFMWLLNPFLIIFSVLISATCFAQGDLLIYPKRIVFEGSRRSHDMNLANSGKDTARYLLSVVQIRMKEDGTFENISVPDSGQNFADKYFRIFPRNVVLPPNEAQTVKVQLINTGELKPGEYRSHLYIRAEAEKAPLGETETLKDSASISVKLVAVFGVSIPVIIRSGENTSSVSISDLSVQYPKDTVPSVKFALNRSGNMSVYGDIAVDYISPEGKTTRVGIVNGISVYTPNPKRFFVMPLSKISEVDYHKGSLHITYRFDAQKNEKLAQERIVLH